MAECPDCGSEHSFEIVEESTEQFESCTDGSIIQTEVVITGSMRWVGVRVIVPLEATDVGETVHDIVDNSCLVTGTWIHPSMARQIAGALMNVADLAEGNVVSPMVWNIDEEGNSE